MQSEVNASSFSRSVQLGFFLVFVYLFVASRCERFDIFDHSSGHMFVRLVVTFFFASRAAPIQGSDSDLSPSVFH